MSGIIKHLQARWNDNEAYPWGEDIQFMGDDFMGPFPLFDGKEYILVAVDYVS